MQDLEFEISTEGFWDDVERANKVLKEKTNVENQIAEYTNCEKLLQDALDFVELDEAEAALESYNAFDELSKELNVKTLLSDEYDKNNAILKINSGTGGLDAQDWADMLLRMYVRYCETKGWTVKLLDHQPDPEAGIKSATLLIEGDYAYGYLKVERGVHRLVRISPYNANGKRQTSFASVDVIPELSEDIEIDIDEKDLRIDTYRSSGAGGQHVNKTDSAIRITHIPTGIVVTCQNERSQLQNKNFAMRMLYSKLYAIAKQEHKEKIGDITGDHSQITWGSQIRNYFLHPYTLVKDARTGFETSNADAVLDGKLDGFINAALSEGIS